MNLPALGFRSCSCGGSTCACSGGLGYLPTHTPWIYNGVKYQGAAHRWYVDPLVPYLTPNENNYGFPPALIAPLIIAGATVAATGVSVGASASQAAKQKKAAEATCPAVAAIDAEILMLKEDRGGLFNTGLFSFNGVGKEIKALKKDRKLAVTTCSAAPPPLPLPMGPPPAATIGMDTTTLLLTGAAMLGVLGLGAVVISRRS